MGKDDSKTKKVPDQPVSGHPYQGIAAKKSYVKAEGGSSRYKAQDPSTCMRVIKDGPDGLEFIISGDREETFAQACRANWYFESVKRKSKWLIVDERGNDVSDSPLGLVDSIFTLIPE
ncbi:MAG: hypothetical protein RTU63_15130 [Candidatus Thorarchaeota archaeon]